jgi:tRNA(Ile)-lysidine synthase
VSGSVPDPAHVARFACDLDALTGGAGRVGIAVSGGGDSLALLLLAASARGEDVEAATVDHGLRKESAAEAALVARICGSLRIAHATLRPDRPLAGNLQSSARRARYTLLDQWRAERRLDWIATAHHADDQAETLLMRLNRGAGCAGLSSVRPVNGRVIRPLLGWRRHELAAITRACGLAAVVDPSNSDERYDRARLRKSLADAPWINIPGLARSAAALEEANEALDWSVALLWSQRASAVAGGWDIDMAAIPAELRRRLVLRAIRALSPSASPRGEAVSRLLVLLSQGRRATLAGVVASGGKSWRFMHAPSRSRLS